MTWTRQNRWACFTRYRWGWRIRRGYDIEAIGNGIREDLTIARCGRGGRVEGGDGEVWGKTVRSARTCPLFTTAISY